MWQEAGRFCLLSSGLFTAREFGKKCWASLNPLRTFISFPWKSRCGKRKIPCHWVTFNTAKILLSVKAPFQFVLRDRVLCWGRADTGTDYRDMASVLASSFLVAIDPEIRKKRVWDSLTGKLSLQKKITILILWNLASEHSVLSVIPICLSVCIYHLFHPRLTDRWTRTKDPHISSHTHSHLTLFLLRDQEHT